MRKVNEGDNGRVVGNSTESDGVALRMIALLHPFPRTVTGVPFPQELTDKDIDWVT